MHTLRLHSPLRTLFAGWHRFHPPESDAVSAACPTCNGQMRTFVCPKWPRCGCPEGAIDPACPGQSVACSCPTHHAVGIC